VDSGGEEKTPLATKTPYPISEEIEAGPGGQHGSENGSLQLPAGVESLQTHDGLLAMEGRRHTLTLLWIYRAGANRQT